MKSKSVPRYTGLFITLIAVMAIGFAGLSLAACNDGNQPCIHTWGAWSVTVDPTCIATGTGTRTCTSCGVTDTNTTIPINPDSHTSNNAKANDCTLQNLCTECGTELTPANTAHDMEWTTTATYISEGEETGTCQLCGHTETKPSPRLPVTSSAMLQTVLSGLDPNTASTPYTILLNVSDLGGSSSSNGSIGNTLQNNNTKFVNLDMSGSTFTTIEQLAFSYCTSLTSITIPDSVTAIMGTNNFDYCTSLTMINVAFDNVNYSSENGVLYNKEKTTLRKYPQGKIDTTFTIPDGVTSIGASAFSDCTSLTSVTIPDSVTTIWGEVFSRCTSLASITIPDGVTSIGNGTFDGCTSLTMINVVFDNVNYSSENGVLYNKAKTTLIKYPQGKIDTTFTIPDSVTTIEGWAFSGCTSLASVTIPDSVTTIGTGAFYVCTSLASVTLPNNSSFTTIGDNAFYGCTSLTSVTIPDSVTSIRMSAFDRCTSLANVTLPNNSSFTTIGSQAFYGCTSLISVTIPAGVTTIEGWAFLGCTSLRTVTFDRSDTIISEDTSFPNGASLRAIYPSQGAGTYVRPSTTWSKQD